MDSYNGSVKSLTELAVAHLAACQVAAWRDHGLNDGGLISKVCEFILRQGQSTVGLGQGAYLV